METVVVIMQKDKNTGMFEKELQTLNIVENHEFLLNIYAIKDEENIFLHIKLTTEKDVLDWEYLAIYDYYDKEIFISKGFHIIECEDEYNPTWEIIIPYTNNENELTKSITQILSMHKCELSDVFCNIMSKKGEYNNEK